MGFWCCNGVWGGCPSSYPRLHGSYERLWAGQVSEALVDLTGGLAERWSLVHAGKEEDQDGGQVNDWVRGSTRKLDLDLLQAVREGCSVSCSTHSAPTGEEGKFSFALCIKNNIFYFVFFIYI